MLTGMENRIIEAREHALSRKDILEKVEKWTLASAEEAWLDEYERVPNYLILLQHPTLICYSANISLYL
jgi:hypothetical protein